MNNNDIEEDIKILRKYLQYRLDNGTHKLFYNDLGYDIKTIDCINAIENISAKANKYDRLVERIKKKKKYFEECQELIANNNENYSDGTVIERFIDLLQELIKEE